MTSDRVNLFGAILTILMLVVMLAYQTSRIIALHRQLVDCFQSQLETAVTVVQPLTPEK